MRKKPLKKTFEKAKALKEKTPLTAGEVNIKKQLMTFLETGVNRSGDAETIEYQKLLRKKYMWLCSGAMKSCQQSGHFRKEFLEKLARLKKY